jgi:hypothetical protein
MLQAQVLNSETLRTAGVNTGSEVPPAAEVLLAETHHSALA